MSNEYIPKKPPGLMIWEEDMKLMIDLPDEQVGRILKALFAFRMNDEVVILDDPLEQSFLRQVTEKAHRDEVNYKETNRQRSETMRNREST